MPPTGFCCHARGEKRTRMEQQLAFPQIQKAASPPQWCKLFIQRLLSLFFADDRSPDNRSIIDLQRRACWIGLALVLQALNEAVSIIPPQWYTAHLPFIDPWKGTISFCLILGSFFMMWMAFRQRTLRQQSRRLAKHPYRWQCAALILVLLTCIAGVAEVGLTIQVDFLQAPQYTNDGTSLDAYAAMVLLQGKDPYVDSNMERVVRLFSLDPSWTTPLREGQFANQETYPSPVEMRTVLDTDLKSGQAPEFEAKVSYPSLSFLTLVPLVWLGIGNVLPFYFLCYIVLVALGWSVARRELRPWIIVFALANVSMWSSVVGGNLDLLTILFLVLAWLWRERRWPSALVLGLAMACKQPAWFYVLFYAILVFRTYDWKEVVRRLTIAGLVMLAFNLPFILWDAKAWLAGVMAPVSDPMFATGVGIVGLVGSPYLHSYLPSIIYAILEYGVFYPLCLMWYWRVCKAHPEAAMLLAVLPLFFAWRSLPSYFACAAFPMFILLAARGNTSKGSLPRHPPALTGPTHSNPSEDASEEQRENAKHEVLALA